MSSYKNKNTRERKEIQQEERKGKKPETIQLNKTKPKINSSTSRSRSLHLYNNNMQENILYQTINFTQLEMKLPHSSLFQFPTLFLTFHFIF